MNCPYCDETINALAKFCPKCGLPLKDDATVMGAYVSDDGPNWTLIGGGAAAIVAIAMSIGFLSSQGNKPAPAQQATVGRPGQPAAAPIFATPVAAYNLNPNAGLSSMNVNAANSMTNTKPRWAYVPPPTPPVQANWQAPMVVEPPRTMVLTSPTVFRRAPVVQIAKSNEPAVPVIPPSELTLLTTPAAPAYVESTPEAALNSEIARREAAGVWVYDPVQERWALRPEAKRRSTGTVRRPPAPSNGYVPAPPPPAPVENPGPIE
jgi:hypothetical protein